METNNPFKDTIDNFNKINEELDNTTRKSNNDNESEDNKDPSYVLYNAIANTSVELLQSKPVISTFKKISEVMGDDVTKSMVEMFAILLTQSSYQAVLFYDSLLKNELDNQLNHFANHINDNRADIDAHNSVLKIFKKQLDEIQTRLNIEKFKNDNHISSDPNND